MRRCTFKIFFMALFDFQQAFEVNMRFTVNTQQFTFFLGSQQLYTFMAQNSHLPLPKTLGPIRICFSLFPCFLLVECVALPRFLWYRVQLWIIRKTASVTLTTFLRTEKKSTSVGMTKKQLHFPVSWGCNRYIW